MTTGAPRRHRWPWVVGGIGVALAALFTWALWPVSLAALDDEVARLRAAGFAMTFEEWYGDMPAKAENGAADLAVAYGQFETAMGSTGFWAVAGELDRSADDPWWEIATPEQIAALRKRLDDARPFFDAVDAALAKPRFKHVVTVDADGNPSLAHTSTFLRTVVLLEARARVAASPADRLAAILALARLASRQEQPAQMDLFIGSAAWAKACCAARDAVATESIAVAQAREALEPWPSGRGIDQLAACARWQIAELPNECRPFIEGRKSSWGRTRSAAERAKERLSRMFGRGKRDGGIMEQLFGPERQVVLTAEDAAAGLRTWSEIASYRAPSHAAAAAWAEDLVGRSSPGVRWLNISLVRQWVRTLTRNDAQIALARVALAAAARHETTGAWPATLDDLRDAFPGESIPLDPYTDAPFVYRVMDDVVRISSVGRLPEDDPVDDATLREQGLLWEFRR